MLSREILSLSRLAVPDAFGQFSRRLSERASRNAAIQEALRQKDGNVIPLPTAVEPTICQPDMLIEETQLPEPTAVIQHGNLTLRVYDATQSEPLTADEAPIAQIEERMHTAQQLTAEELKAASEEFRELLDGSEPILEKTTPRNWLRSIARYVLAIQKDLTQNPDKYSAPVREYFTTYLIPNIMTALRRQAEKGRTDPSLSSEEIALATLDVIHDICEGIPFQEVEPAELHYMSIDDVIATSNGRIRSVTKLDQYNEERRYLEIQSPSTGEWHAFPLPNTDNVMHKGGIGRVVAKIIAGAPDELIDAELPPNDFDVVAYGDLKEIYEETDRMGVDREGVEIMSGPDKLGVLVAERDFQLNQVLVGRDGIIYTQGALQTAHTGELVPCPAPRRLYPVNVSFLEGIPVANPCLTFRLIKFIAEGKAKSFEFTELNRQIDLGVFTLVLARKFAKKAEKGELLSRYYFLLKQMGFVREGEKTIYDVLDRVHSEYPFFNFESEEMSQEGIAKWLNGKLIKYLHRSFKSTYKVPASTLIERTEGDTIPKVISLKGYHYAHRRAARIAEGWDAFMERCRERTAAYEALPTDEKEKLRKAKSRLKEAEYSIAIG